MKKNVMDKEKFDLKLREGIQRFDQEYISEFNEERVWKNINRSTSRRTWLTMAAASVIIILGLSILFQQYNKPLVITRLKKPAIISKGQPLIRFEQKPIVLNKIRPQINKHSVKNPEKNGLSANIIPDTSSRVTVENYEIESDTNKVVVQRTAALQISDLQTDIKVTFKRGSTATRRLPEESKLTLKKFKLRIFENQIYDTSAYASGAEIEAGRKFRIKF